MSQDSSKKQNHQQILICTHIKKLTKKQVTQILQNPTQTKCQTHQKNINDNTLCLSCNKLFCGINSKQKCILTHHQVQKDHVFSINMNNGCIFCSQCNQNIEFSCQFHNDQQNQDIKKLKRFIQFIKQTYAKLKQINQQKKLEQTILSTVNYRGLQNLGNTCFLNSVLQVLNFSKPLEQLYQQYKITPGNFSKIIVSKYKPFNKEIQYFYDQVIQQGQNKIWHVVSKKKDKAHQHNQKLIKTITSCKFNEIFKQFYTEMHKQQEKSYPFEAIQILNFLSHIDRKYSFKQEQDAQEALLFIIDILVQGQLITMGYDLQRYNKVQKLIGRQKISPSQRVFGTYLVSQIFCSQCKKINYTFDLSYHLSINLESKTNLAQQAASLKRHLSKSIQIKNKVYYKNLKYPQNQHTQLVLSQFLYSFFNQQRLTQRQNFYSCSDCKSLIGLKKFYLIDLPEILIISIKRLGHKMTKNNKYVKFEQQIDLTDVTLVPELDQQQGESLLSRNSCKYALYAVIVHIGDTIHNGHYVCYVKTKENIWLRCSDSQIKKVTFKEVKQQQAYVLLYQQIKHQQKQK